MVKPSLESKYNMYVDNKEQCSGTSSLLPLCELWGFNSGYWAWQGIPLPTEHLAGPFYAFVCFQKYTKDLSHESRNENTKYPYIYSNNLNIYD